MPGYRLVREHQRISNLPDGFTGHDTRNDVGLHALADEFPPRTDAWASMLGMPTAPTQSHAASVLVVRCPVLKELAHGLGADLRLPAYLAAALPVPVPSVDILIDGWLDSHRQLPCERCRLLCSEPGPFANRFTRALPHVSEIPAALARNPLASQIGDHGASVLLTKVWSTHADLDRDVLSQFPFDQPAPDQIDRFLR